MKRLSVSGVLIFAIACAHAPQETSTRVIVNASEAAAGVVDTAVLQRIIEAETQLGDGVVREPLSLTVFFDSRGFVERPEIRLGTSSRNWPDLVSANAIRDLSATPWDDGLIVEYGDRVHVHSRTNTHWRREVVVGTYTISDDAGTVREQRPVVVGALDPEVSMMGLQLTSMKTTGHYLAGRVSALRK